MRFITLIPLSFWGIAIALGVLSYTFGLYGFVAGAIAFMLLLGA